MKTNKKKGMPVRSKIFIALAVLTLAVLAVLWICQTFFLGFLHRAVKKNEMARCADAICAADDGELARVCEELGTKYDVCVSVFDAGNGYGELASWHSNINPFCFIHGFLSDSMIYDLAANTVDGRDFIRTVKIGDRDKSGADEGESVLFSRASRERLIVLNAHISPLSTTVTTLRIMSAAISAAMLAASFILSYFLAKRLSDPLVRMRKEARRLASGDYGVRFEGGGSRETEELAETLNMAAHELSETDRIRRDLIANVSHDLRTPLTLISGYAEIMRDIPGEMNEENVSIIVEETKTLSTLVSDMLEASKLTDGAVTISKEPFSITEELGRTVEIYSKLKEAEGYRIILDADGDATVTADRTRIREVVYNLLNNAINYTGEDKTVTIRQRTGDGVCRVEVVDTGDGIPEDELPLIWDRYYKSKEFHRRASLGTGLGLSIVKNILMLHGAGFGVKSAPGMGSAFWFELPLADEGTERS